MQKEELKSLARDMCKNLIDSIDEQDNATIEQLINYLKNSIEAISSINDNDITTLEEAKATFVNAYKDIAAEGLLNYQITNGKFSEIYDEHNKVLTDCLDNQIDIQEMRNKFKNIQVSMIGEIEKANKVIHELSHRVQALEIKSNIDSLTKVFNRRALNTYLDSVCVNASSNYKVHMLMLDLDNFKEMNDTHGHVAGDKVLIFVSNILKKTLRDGDKIFRYGGEEFIVVLNRTDDEYCIKVANRILDLIRANHLIYKGTTLTITATIGATAYIEGDDQDSLIARADKALYNAKKNGKDQVYKDMG